MGSEGSSGTCRGLSKSVGIKLQAQGRARSGQFDLAVALMRFEIIIYGSGQGCSAHQTSLANHADTLITGKRVGFYEASHRQLFLEATDVIGSAKPIWISDTLGGQG